VYRLIKAGKIPAVRVGRQWRFRKRDIDAWLESQQRPRAGRATGSVRAIGPPTGRPRVLVVDDEAAIRDLLSKTLALAEYDVDLAPDGRTALERLRIIPHDLLITDLKMPGVDGLSVIREARRLKADPRHHHYRLLQRSERDRRRQPGRRGLPHQAVSRAARACRRCQSARRVASLRDVPPPRRCAKMERFYPQ
jgi:CheY-like chemotaxis protein